MVQFGGDGDKLVEMTSSDQWFDQETTMSSHWVGGHSGWR